MRRRVLDVAAEPADDCRVSPQAVAFPAVVIGGGAAGLWLLDELTRRNHAALLLEAHALGAGQTIASQGIIHGGLKYTLKGAFTRSAGAIADMPGVWRECLEGRRQPNLRNTIVRAPYCHLWRTESLSSKLSMIGARVGLRVRPVAVPQDARPQILADCPGTVQRIDEHVIDPASFLKDLADQHRSRIIKIEPGSLRVAASRPVTIDIEAGQQRATITADRLILAAGQGNAALREMLTQNGDRVRVSGSMQRRPLHMVMLRGSPEALPELNGHCVDGGRTRVTITTARDSGGRNVWQVGGQVAEDGVAMEPAQLIAHARRELQESLAGFEPNQIEWSTYRVDRAEGVTSSGARPDDVTIFEDHGGTIITAWPTKLALVPQLARQVAENLAKVTRQPPTGDPRAFEHWPRPDVALPPWETATQWFADA